jgi:3-methyladenine DNA glycosylase AlkD
LKYDQLVRSAIAEIRSLPVKNTPSIRRVRKRLNRELRDASPRDVVRVAEALIARDLRWVGYELIRHHPAALLSLKKADVEKLGRGISSWDQVDTFGLYISGPAWREQQITDRDVMRWAKSADRWWRRTALVSTIPLNARAHGGSGDTRRTLRICATLAHDHDDMVETALSWALRILIGTDRRAVTKFLNEHEGALGARVSREARNKLATGLKNPRYRGGRRRV